MDIKEKEALLCSKYNNINRLLAIMNVEKQDREDLLQDQSAALSEAVKRCGEDGRVALEHYQKRSESSLASGHEKQGIPAFSGCGRN